MVHQISLLGYSAVPAAGSVLHLGTAESYGVEQLQLTFGPEWEALTVTATFLPPGGYQSPVRVLVPAGGLVEVPPEATASASISQPGLIVFAGVSNGVQRITGNLRYTVAPHAPVEGQESTATPDIFAQYAAHMQEIVDKKIPPDGLPGQFLTVTGDGTGWAYPPASGGGSGSGYIIGEGLKLDSESNTLSVNTADAAEQDNTLPISSAAVFTAVGNIETLLGTI